MKKLTKVLGIFLLLTVCLFTPARAGNYRILINNQELYTSVPPVMRNGRILVPLRAIGEAMDCEVIWVSGTQTANLKNETTIVSMQIGNKKISKMKRTDQQNITIVETDVPPALINNSTYVPLRALAESLDAVVGWDEATQTVMVVYDTTLRYAGNWTISNFAGNGDILNHDSVLSNMSFVSPESIDIAADGTIYVADSGKIRRIRNGKSETITLSPSYLTASALQCYGNQVYILTHEFEDNAGMAYYGIARLDNNTADGIFITEAAYSKITDFSIADDGTIYVLQNNVGVGENYLGKLEPEQGTITVLCTVDDGIQTLTAGPNGRVYLGNTVEGSLYWYKPGDQQIQLLAGVDGNTKFIDGPNPMFFEPIQMEYYDGSLYIIDYNVIRKLTLNMAGAAIQAETIAGKISVDKNPATQLGKASETTFAHSYLMDLVVRQDGVILLTDPKKAVIRMLEEE